MSDYQYDADYGEDYQYEQEQEMGQMEEEQNIQATIQIDYFNAEELIRQNNYGQALEAFKQIYSLAEKNNLRNWKIKTITQILEIHTQKKNSQEVQKTLSMIQQINQKDRLTQSAIRSVISILQKLPRQQYLSYWPDLFKLIDCLDENSVLKSYIIMLQKEVNQKNKKQSEQIYAKFKQNLNKASEIAVGTQLQIYSLDIKYYKLHNKSIQAKLRTIQLKLPLLEEQTHVNDTHLSFIKQQIAQIMYEEGSYQQCTNYLCDSFCENAKFGKNTDKLKQLLKVTVLTLLLCDNQELFTKKQYNPLLHESASTFKMEQDIQALYGLIQAFKIYNLESFEEIFKIVKVAPSKSSAFHNIYERCVIQLKKQKILYICKPYKKISFNYISSRVHQKNPEIIIEILFELINSKKLSGVINLSEKYLEVLPEKSQYYTVQLKNLRELTLRL